MRIALVITELHPGGAEKCCVNLACYLQARGHQVGVWQLWPAPPPDRRQLTAQLDQHGIAWRSGNARSATHFVRATRWLRRELIAFQPDATQSFLFHANLSAALVHGLSPSRLPGRLYGGARVVQPERWRQKLQYWAAGRMDKLVCVSPSVAEHCRLQEGIAVDKLLVIPNGLDLSASLTENPSTENPSAQNRVCWSAFGLPRQARVLLFVGRLTAQKGIVEFMSRTAPELLAQLPNHHLVLMGDGEQAAELRRLIGLSAAAARIHLVGWQPQPMQWMQAAELLFLPTRYEGMPNVILEAMGVAKPVVSFDVDGVRELLGDEATATAQIVPPRDWPAFGAAIVELANDQALQVSCGQANMLRVRRHFDLNDQLARYEQLYQSL